ncbi:MAG: Crp/Fnr family transcriptional regulator [Chloroflexi bacterium]|nr:Crp/Fnr family transcriptional regulator [Chloroflexota bacterium]MBV9893037.1 Crp/Fnr family transcriptional regulator [Chloroflexota bacterium]
MPAILTPPAGMRPGIRQKPRAVSVRELRALRSSFFDDLATDDLAALGAVMFQRQYPAGQIVLLEGAASSVLYVVQAGRLKLFKTSARGREQVLRLLRPGDMFNEVAVFDEGPNPASAQAIEDCTLYLLRRRDLMRFVAERPGIALAVTRTFARRLREALALVEDLAFRDVTSRLAKILLEGGDSGDGAPRLTQELLAAMAGSRREVVGRALKALSQEGAVKLERGKIHVRDRKVLERLA